MDYSEFKCKWIEPVSLWNVADETRNKYWPESTLPVNTEEIVEFRLGLKRLAPDEATTMNRYLGRYRRSLLKIVSC